MLKKKTTKPIRLSLVTGIVAVLLAACQPNTLYHSFHTLPQDGWSKSDTLLFPVDLYPYDSVEARKTHTCQVEVEIRHTTALNMASLWIVVYNNARDSLHFTTDTLQCVLANYEGRFTGTGLNHYYQKSFPLGEVTFRPTHTPTFKVAHYMKKGRIEGVHDVGIRVVEK